MTLSPEAQKLLPEGRFETLNAKHQSLVRRMSIGLSDEHCAERSETTKIEIRRQVTKIADDIGILSGQYEVRRRALYILGKNWNRNSLTIEERSERFRILDAIYDFAQSKSGIVLNSAPELEQEEEAEEEVEVAEVTVPVKAPEPSPSATNERKVTPTIQSQKVPVFPDALTLATKIERLSPYDRKMLREVAVSPWGGNVALALKLGVGYNSMGLILGGLYKKVDLPHVQGRNHVEARKKLILEAFELLEEEVVTVREEALPEPKQPQPEPSPSQEETPPSAPEPPAADMWKSAVVSAKVTHLMRAVQLPSAEELAEGIKTLRFLELQRFRMVCDAKSTNPSGLAKELAGRFGVSQGSVFILVPTLYKKIGFPVVGSAQYELRRELIRRALKIFDSLPTIMAEVPPEVEHVSQVEEALVIPEAEPPQEPESPVESVPAEPESRQTSLSYQRTVQFQELGLEVTLIIRKID